MPEMAQPGKDVASLNNDKLIVTKQDLLEALVDKFVNGDPDESQVVVDQWPTSKPRRGRA